MKGEPTNGPWRTRFVTDSNGEKWYEIMGPHDELIAILPRNREDHVEEAANMRLIRRASNLLVLAGMAEYGLKGETDPNHVIREIRRIREEVYG